MIRADWSIVFAYSLRPRLFPGSYAATLYSGERPKIAAFHDSAVRIGIDTPDVRSYAVTSVGPVVAPRS